jgi:hypothetical protein
LGFGFLFLYKRNKYKEIKNKKIKRKEGVRNERKQKKKAAGSCGEKPALVGSVARCGAHRTKLRTA